MDDQTDQQLLRNYAERQSEAAFAAIVQRYVDLVYSAALRLSCDARAAKVIAMTALQKPLVTATLAALAGAGIYEARQASQLRDRVQTLQQQQAPLAEQIQQVQQERDDATNRLAGFLATHLRTGSVNDLPAGTWFIVEKAPVDKDYDSRVKFGLGTSTIIATGIGEAGDPDDRSY